MIDEHVHAWDQPRSTHEPAGVRAVTTPRQVLSGLQIGLANLQTLCTCCGQPLHEGDTVGVYAYRAADDPEWQLTRCYCPDCLVPRIESPTLGTSEVLVEACLNVVSLVDEQRHHLCLGAIELLAESPLTEGDKP